MFATLRRNRRTAARGFSLIELGIVIAVIAVLASVVIFGRGFIVAGRVSKAVEGLTTVRKAGAAYAGLQGGTVTASTGPEITSLANRSLLPEPAKAGSWVVAGDPNDLANQFKVEDIRFGINVNQNAVAIKLKTPGKEQAEDVFNSVLKDGNYVKTNALVGGLTCQGSAAKPTTNTAVFCFNL